MLTFGRRTLNKDLIYRGNGDSYPGSLAINQGDS